MSAGSDDRFLELEDLIGAVERLRAVGLRRGGSSMIRWLLLKRAGLTSQRGATVTAEDCVEFADDFFGLPGEDAYRWFNPFAKSETAWLSGEHNHWGVQTIWTQVERGGNQAEQRTYEQRTKTKVEREGREVVAVTVRPVEWDTYIRNLSREFASGNRGERISVRDLALWRFRVSPVTVGTEETALAVALVTELQIGHDEFEAAFADDAEIAERIERE